MIPTDRARLAGDLAAFALQTTEQAARLAAAGDRAGLFRLCMTAPIAQRAIIERHQPAPGWTVKGWRRRLKRGWVYPHKPAPCPSPRSAVWTSANLRLSPWRLAAPKEIVVLSDRSPDPGLWTSASIERIPARRPPLVIFDDLDTP